ncbi:cytosol aminopeptidase [Drosophila bipectinata]|uniref:cytosol aminopeptidase n=1 Tax=Drosophila bipectinata TaxID=42026 RepID=UPI001C8A95B8|nr:cytosol aminopeptidase [Drosophila bipectinata]
MTRSHVMSTLRRSAIGLLKGHRVSRQKQIFLNQLRCKCEDHSSPSSIEGVVIGVYSNEGEKSVKLSAGGEQFDDRVGGKITELIKESGFNGALGQGRVYQNVDKEFCCVAVVGLGKQGVGYNAEEVLDEGMENVRICSAVGARALQMQGCAVCHVDGMDYPEQAAEGAAMAVWRYNVNKRKSDRVTIPKLELYGSSDQDAWTRGLFKAESQNLARRLADTPANQMTPSIFAQATVDALCPCGVSVEVRTMDWIEMQGLNSFLTVAKGSCEPPIILEVSYCGTAPEERPILLLGKGLTFNSGGLCLLPRKGMDEYRGAVGGAAVCVAAIRAAAALSLPINVSAVLPLCENMPSGMAAKPGDVVTLLNGKTMHIKDISLAGTLLLADPLLYAQSIFKPKLIIDVGSMASGVRKGLGASATGLWTNNSFLWKNFQKAGSLTGDRLWRMPLWKYFSSLVAPDKSYDICNKGHGHASSCLAAAALFELVPCADWVHLDTHGTGMLATHGVPPYLLKGSMTGRPTRSIIQFLYQMGCK